MFSSTYLNRALVYHQNTVDRIYQKHHSNDNNTMNNYHRLANNALIRLIQNEENRIIAILGARQVGKTTLLKQFSSIWKGRVARYSGDLLEHAELWRGTFADVKHDLEIQFGGSLETLNETVLLIFDEVQKIPESFNNLKILYDDFRKKIKIAISGSSSLVLLHRTSESLGGRVEIVTMYPLSFSEIFSQTPRALWMKKCMYDFKTIEADVLKTAERLEEFEEALNQAFSNGLFPESYQQKSIEEVKLLHQNYHQTYIEKDVRALKQVGNVLDFDRVWRLAQRANAQLLHLTNISMNTGLAFNTVKNYISVLSASFNIILLSAFVHGISSRIVKSPKIYSLDLGFFCHSTGLWGRELLTSSGFAGFSFESVMIQEFFKQERSFILNGEPYFFRTSAGSEVDLVIEKSLELYGFEFKISEKISASDFRGIKSLMAVSKAKVKVGFVVSRQPYAEKFGENLFAVPWWYFCVE